MNVFVPVPPESGASDGDLQLRDSVAVGSDRSSGWAALGPVGGAGVATAQTRALPHVQPGRTAPPHGGDAKETRPVKRLKCKKKTLQLGGRAAAHCSELHD